MYLFYMNSSIVMFFRYWDLSSLVIAYVLCCKLRLKTEFCNKLRYENFCKKFCEEKIRKVKF